MRGIRARLVNRVPWGFVGMICLIGAVEATIGHFVRHSDVLANDWRHAAKAAAGMDATAAEILCLGDSQTKMGLQARVLEARLNRSTYNLAVLAGPAATTNALLCRVLEAGGHPRLITVNHMPLLLKADVDRYLDQWPALLTVREAWQLARVEHRPDLMIQFGLRRILPSLQGRNAIRNYILATVRGKPFAATEQVLVQRRNMLANRGSLLAGKEHGRMQETSRLDEAPKTWEFAFANAASLSYVEQFLAMTAARRIVVVWVLPPCRPDWQAYRDRHGLENGYEKALHRLQEKYVNLDVIDCRHSHYAEVFVDSTHLDRLGATSLSADLAALVERLLPDHPDAARWQKLPDFQPSTIGEDLEDLEQSKLALGQRERSPSLR